MNCEHKALIDKAMTRLLENKANRNYLRLGAVWFCDECGARVEVKRTRFDKIELKDKERLVEQFLQDYLGAKKVGDR